MKFERKKVQGIMDTEVRHTLDEVQGGYDPFEIVATPQGVYLTGRSPAFHGRSDLDIFAKTVAAAMQDYLDLKKCKLSKLCPTEGSIL